MKESEKVFNKLKELNIDYDVVNHPQALSMEDADKYIEGKDGARTKTLFLSTKKSEKFYLIALDENKRLDIKKTSELLGVKNLRFASEKQLIEKISLPIGMVSIFGILNNEEKDITVVLDEDMLVESVLTFCANDCTKTVFIEFDDVCKFVLNAGNELLIEKL
ncbi:MAG: prolyl-tRNA synthetase associated domain-containing protein [Peptostreptococcaceae bacterium]|nr:prolyl-tRNA synthetase associated domain-containing protein [Peptostreptococcaceae bacterium]